MPADVVGPGSVRQDLADDEGHVPKRRIPQWVRPKDLDKKFRGYYSARDTAACWEWRGPKMDYYGDFRLNGFVYAHEYAWARTLPSVTGVPRPLELEPGVGVGHRCGNPMCVNPAHLFVGAVELDAETQAERLRRRLADRDKAVDMVPVRHTLAKLFGQPITAPLPSTDE